jgi:hypothetical protein
MIPERGTHPQATPPPTGHWGRRARLRRAVPGQRAVGPATAPPLTEDDRSADRAARRGSVEIAACACAAILAAFLLLDPETVHWFVIPVYLCGVVAGADAVDWLRQRRGLLDPVGLVGLLGVHFFFLAPLLQVVWGYSVAYVVPPDDWRPWLGWMACFNAVGLCLYRFVVTAIEHRPLGRSRWVWELRSDRFGPFAAAGMAASVLLQAWIYLVYGGVTGYVAAYSRLSRDEFQGMGFANMFAEIFPVLAMLAYAVYARRSGRGRSLWTVLAALACFFVLRVFFGGLRGSRAAYVWPMFWMLGVIHLWVRPISRKVVLAGALLLVVFMYTYGIYKAYGENASNIIGHGDISKFTAARNRGLDTTVLSDLGRADIQAYVLSRLWSPRSRGGYEYAFGRTYVGAATLVIPSSLWRDRPPTKVKEGTELMYGVGVWNTRHFIASFAYGLAGETMLNFGPLAVPLAYAAFGCLVGVVSRWTRQLSPNDSRMLLVPYIVSLCPFFLLWDSDVILVYVITQGLLPLLLIRASSVAKRTEG